MISISLQPRADGVSLKDTFTNIRDTGEFVVNMATVPNSDAVHLLTLARDYAETVIAAVHGEDEAVCMMADGCAVWSAQGIREIART